MAMNPEARRAADRVLFMERRTDLAVKLLESSQAMANDWTAFARAVEEEARRLNGNRQPSSNRIR